MVGNGFEPCGSGRGPRYRSFRDGVPPCIALERRRLLPEACQHIGVRVANFRPAEGVCEAAFDTLGLR
jgi:hypothetical protein